MTTLKLTQKHVEEIISLLRGSNNQKDRHRVADNLEYRLSAGGTTFVCANCGKVFPQKTGRPRKTCSDLCRQAVHRRKYGNRHWREKAPAWTEQEVETLISAVGQYYGTQHWVFGQRAFAWSAVASEVGRTVAACHTKYKHLVRQGVVAEWGER